MPHITLSPTLCAGPVLYLFHKWVRWLARGTRLKSGKFASEIHYFNPQVALSALHRSALYIQTSVFLFSEKFGETVFTSIFFSQLHIGLKHILLNVFIGRFTEGRFNVFKLPNTICGDFWRLNRIKVIWHFIKQQPPWNLHIKSWLQFSCSPIFKDNPIVWAGMCFWE